MFNPDINLALLRQQFGAVAADVPTSYAFALTTTVPDDEGLGYTEPTDAAYARITLTNNTTNFGLNEDGDAVINLTSLVWAQATEPWGTLVGIIVFDDASSYVSFFEFSPPKGINTNGRLRMDIGSLILNPSEDPIDVYLPEENVTADILTDTAGVRWFVSVDTSGGITTISTDLPGPPSVPTVLAWDGTKFTWTEPAFDGGIPVTGYTLHRFEDLELTRIPIEADATEYETTEVGLYYITAENPVGSSAASNEVTVV